jgi:hypothetical protein
VGPRAGPDTVVRRKIASPCRDSNPRSSSPYLGAIPAPGTNICRYNFLLSILLTLEKHKLSHTRVRTFVMGNSRKTCEVQCELHVKVG